VAGVVERIKGEGWDQFSNRYGDWRQDMVLFLARPYCGMTLKELGERAGVLLTFTHKVLHHRVSPSSALPLTPPSANGFTMTGFPDRNLFQRLV
jgi:hypothetical protein